MNIFLVLIVTAHVLSGKFCAIIRELRSVMKIYQKGRGVGEGGGGAIRAKFCVRKMFAASDRGIAGICE